MSSVFMLSKLRFTENTEVHMQMVNNDEKKKAGHRNNTFISFQIVSQ